MHCAPTLHRLGIFAFLILSPLLASPKDGRQGGLAKQQVVAKANCSQASKMHTSPESECEDEGDAETVIPRSRLGSPVSTGWKFGSYVGKPGHRYGVQ